MTEYDYSPDAIERHNAKQAQIADWVHRTHQHPPASPFHPVSTAYSDAYHHPRSPSESYYSYPASYSSPYGVIPSQYAGSSGYGHRHRHRRHSGSGSVYPTPYYATNVAAPYLPMNMNMNMGYGPMLQRSFSTPSIAMMGGAPGMIGLPGTTWMGQQPYGYGGGYYPPMQPAVYPTPYYASGYPTYPQPYMPLTTPRHHHSHRRRHGRSRSDSELYVPTAYPYGSAGSYVPMGGGGYAVLPSGQQGVISNYPYASTSPYIVGYDSDSDDSRHSL